VTVGGSAARCVIDVLSVMRYRFEKARFAEKKTRGVAGNGQGHSGERNCRMLGDLDFPITIVEFDDYANEADAYFGIEEHETLRSYLAMHPESGTVLRNCGGVRVLEWPLKRRLRQPRVRVVYYFRDLNMPLYLLAFYGPGERIALGVEITSAIKSMVDELVAEHGRQLASIVRRQLSGRNESA